MVVEIRYGYHARWEVMLLSKITYKLCGMPVVNNVIILRIKLLPAYSTIAVVLSSTRRVLTVVQSLQ